MFGSHRATIAQNRGVLDYVLELADVSGPRVRAQRGDGVGLERLRFELLLPCEVRQEVARQHLDVALAVAQRRQRDPEDVEPVVQVFTELQTSDSVMQRVVRRGHDAATDLDLLQTAQAAHAALLERAQQLGL